MVPSIPKILLKLLTIFKKYCNGAVDNNELMEDYCDSQRIKFRVEIGACAVRVQVVFR